MTAIKTKLRATILTGALAFLPNLAAAADTSQPSNAEPTEGVPDHAQAEARGTPTETNTSVPDHAQAEARGGQDTETASTTKGIPDHAEAEARSAGWQ